MLGNLQDRFARRVEQLPLSLNWDLDASRKIHLRPRQMLQVARIVQEAVTNAIRHSGAQAIHVVVAIEEQGRKGWIEIRDNGCGFDPDGPQKGRGLANLRQRAQTEGWVSGLHSGSDGEGTRVTLDLGEVYVDPESSPC